MIDGWLTFLWISNELPLYALLDGTTKLSERKKKIIGNQIKTAFGRVERHLRKKNKSHHHESERENHPRLYMVGVDGYTVADYSLAVSLYFMHINDIEVSSFMKSD